MNKFLKENIIFIVNSMLLVGLFWGVSELRKIPDANTNQVNTDQMPSVTTEDTTTPPQAAPVTTLLNTEKKAPAKVSAPTPPPASSIRTRGFSDDERGDE